MNTTRTILGIAALAALLASCSHPVASTPTAPPAASAATATTSHVAERAAKIGQPFDVPPWRITVTGMKCGKATDLADTGTGYAGDVCVFGVTLVNVGKKPLDFSNLATTNSEPSPTYYGLDAEGRQFTGWSWARGVTNPGNSQPNELVFEVPTGLHLTGLQIADVAVTT